MLSAILGLFPGIVDLVAHALQIGYPPIFAVVMAISFMLIKLILNDIERSRQERNIVRLNQRMAILEAQLHDKNVKPIPETGNQIDD